MLINLFQSIAVPFANAATIVGLIAPGIPGCNFTTGRITAQCIPEFIGHTIQIIISFIGAFLIINIIIAGYQIAIANVIDDKTAGKNRLIWSMIGFTVCVSCYLIVDLILDIFLSGSTN